MAKPTGVYKSANGRYRLVCFEPGNWQVDCCVNGGVITTYPFDVGDVFASRSEAIAWIREQGAKPMKEAEMPADGTWT